jgi:hypothetical protein
MEFPLEGILETLLVGAIVSLLLLSFLFFFFGHVLRIEPVRRFFTFLLADDHQLLEPADLKEKGETGRGHRPSPKARGEEKIGAEASHHMNFILIVLVAVLYGLGVISESVSHRVMSEADANSKIESFVVVGRGQLKSGRNDVQLARLMADYDGCQSRKKLRVKSKSLLCGQIHDRIVEFFHNAKNLVFQNDSFRTELSALESRINFARSLFGALFCLSGELVLVILAAGISEHLYNWYRKHPRRALSRSLNGFPAWTKDLAIHWVNLAAVRCVWIFLGVAGFTALAWLARGEADKQFDMRVFGYAISLEDARQGEGPRFAEEHTDDESRGDRDEGQSVTRGKSVMPKSPYLVFGLDNGKQFEPSAVASVHRSTHVIVVNYKGGPDAFLLFDLQGTDELRNPRPINIEDPVFANLGWIESLYARAPLAISPDGGLPPELVELFASTTFVSTPGHPTADRDRRIISFTVDPNATTPKALDPRELKLLGSPCDPFGGKSCEIEGITLRTIKDEKGQDAEQLLFGVKKVDGVPTIAIVAMQLDGMRWGNPKAVFQPAPKKLDDGCNYRSGVSDLTDGPDGSVYMLTSIELETTDKGCGAEGAEGAGQAGGLGGNVRQAGGAGGAGDLHGLPLSAVAQVGGALWLLPADLLDNRGLDGTFTDFKKRPLLAVQEFAHKPEGVADLADGAMLIVFDDEGHRKSRTWAPDTFALNQNESVFAVVPAAALRPED